MTSTAERPVAVAPGATAAGDVAPPAPLAATFDRPGLAEGVTLLGPVGGSGYRDGVALVRRPDGQMVQLGPLMYAVLEALDGERDTDAIATVAGRKIGRIIGTRAVQRLLEKLGQQGLLAGTESAAPPRRNPLLAMRWKVLVTNQRITRAIAAPFTWLFRPWVMWPVLAAFAAVCWYVLVQHGVASATAQAFANPALLLLVFALTVISAAVHEIGHSAACRYAGAEPGGMGMGLYLVWPAFYTDVTDAYRLDRRSRLRVDLAGLYFNAVVAVATMAVWLAVRIDALLLLVALQLLQMVKQLSPVIRADGYHILADATGVPDLFAHLGPTLRRLVPGRHREPSALTGRARLLVTAWVLVIVPVLLSLMAGAVLVLPHLMTSAWDSGRNIVSGMSHDAGTGGAVSVLADLLRLVALVLPVFATLLVTQRLVRTSVKKGRAWSAGRPGRRVVAVLAGCAVLAGVVFAWWPAGQYQPVRASERGTIGSLVNMLGSPRTVAASDVPTALTLPAGPHLALSAVPVGGATAQNPALFLVNRGPGQQPVAILSDGTPASAAASPSPSFTTRTDGRTTIISGGTTSGMQPIDASAFPFALPAAPGPHGTQALATNTKDGGTVYNIEYALVTVRGNTPVDETNSAFAYASCNHCTTVAVSVQVVLVIGQSDRITPIDAAGALNSACPACATTAIADQIVVTLKRQPPKTLERRLEAALAELGDLKLLGAQGNPAKIAAGVAAVQQQIDQMLQNSGLLAQPLVTPTPATSTAGQSSPATTPSMASTSPPANSASGSSGSSATSSTSGSASTSANSSGTATSSGGTSNSAGASTPEPSTSPSASSSP